MKNKFIKIESKGIIDTQAFILLGASSKKTDNTKIGFFGSGLKYSIAFLLLHEIKFKVFAEYKEIIFGTEKTNFRNQDFDVIVIDGVKSNMSTEMGFSWKPWFAIREIYCNAIDEGDSNISIVDKEDCLPVEDKTTFYIECTNELSDIIKNWDLYFSENREDLVYSDSELNQIYTGGDKLIIYRKGIQCMFNAEQKTIFSYDMSWVKINESRVIENDWDFRYKLKEFLQKIKDKKIIAQILNKINDSWESDFYWDHSSSLYSDVWLSVIGDKVLVPQENAGFWIEMIKEYPDRYLFLPNKMISGLKDRFLDDIRVIGDTDGVKGNGDFRHIKELNKKQQSLLDDSISFLKTAGYDIKHEIKVGEFSVANRLGQALNDKILLSTKLFDLGKKQIVAVLIEEQEHLQTGFSDETRQFQNHFINKYVSALEELTGKYL